MSSLKTSQHISGQGESSLRSKPSRPVISFPSYIHYGYNDHQSDDCVYYPRCELCASYDHDTQNHNRIISLRRGIKPRNPQHVTKHCETCGSNAHTITDHNDIEWSDRLECGIYRSIQILPVILNHPKSTGSYVIQVEFFEGWKPLSPLQLVVEEVMSE
ncbi:hypothetical protein Tco_0586771 [Tanacetum coccineum]